MVSCYKFRAISLEKQFCVYKSTVQTFLKATLSETREDKRIYTIQYIQFKSVFTFIYLSHIPFSLPHIPFFLFFCQILIPACHWTGESCLSWIGQRAWHSNHPTGWLLLVGWNGIKGHLKWLSARKYSVWRMVMYVKLILIFMIIMFYIVSVNTELANTEHLAPAGNTGLVSCEPLVTVFLSPDQHIPLFHGVLLFKDTLFYSCIYIASH